jgi:hypothetical protein
MRRRQLASLHEGHALPLFALAGGGLKRMKIAMTNAHDKVRELI